MPKATLSNRELKKTITDFIKLLTTHNITPSKIILFGSYSTGRPRAHSDIDLAIISTNFRHKNRMRIQETIANAIKERTGLITLIEPIGFSPDEFKYADRATFLGEIKRTGRVLNI